MQLYITCEKSGGLHLAEPGLTAGRHAGRQTGWLMKFGQGSPLPLIASFKPSLAFLLLLCSAKKARNLLKKVSIEVLISYKRLLVMMSQKTLPIPRDRKSNVCVDACRRCLHHTAPKSSTIYEQTHY